MTKETKDTKKANDKSNVTMKKVTYIMLSIFMVLLISLFVYLFTIYNKLGNMEFEGQMNANPGEVTVVPDTTDDVAGLPEIEIETPSPTPDITAQVTPTFTPSPSPVPDGITNILIIGCDSKKMHSYANARSDVNMILTIDQVNNEVKLSSYARDTLVYYDFLNNNQGGYNKLNAALQFYDHPDGVIKTIEENFTVNIHHYMITDFWGVEKLINTLGGVRVYLTDKETHALNDVLAAYNRAMGEALGDNRPIDQHFVTHGAGVKLLNGRQAVSFMRIRAIGGDLGRIDRQHEVLEELKKKIMNMDLIDVVKIIDKMPDMLHTDMSQEEIIEYAGILYDMKDLELQHLTVPIQGTWQYGRYNGMSVINVDFYENNEQLIEFIYH